MTNHHFIDEHLSLCRWNGITARAVELCDQRHVFNFDVIGIPGGILLGIVAAFNRGNLIDRGIIFTTTLIRAIPTLVAVPLLIFVFAYQIRIVPPGGWEGIFSTSAILPVLWMASGAFGGYARLTRASVLEVLSSDYVRTGRAKGLSETLLMYRHVLRNAFIPLVTFLGFALGGLVEGTLLIETLFGIPGLGRLGFEAISARDYPIVIALTVVAAAAFALSNLWADLFYGVIDPRIRNT